VRGKFKSLIGEGVNSFKDGKKASKQLATHFSPLTSHLSLPSFLFTLSLILLTSHLSLLTAHSETTILQTGVSINKVPKEFYGTWRVSSRLVTSNNPDKFKENNIDLWNLSRTGDVITLENPFSGASASITFDTINGNYLKFRKVGNYDEQKLTDVVELQLGKNSFTGTNNIKLDTISDEGYVMKCERATYKLTGEKISGENIK